MQSSRKKTSENQDDSIAKLGIHCIRLGRTERKELSDFIAQSPDTISPAMIFGTGFKGGYALQRALPDGVIQTHCQVTYDGKPDFELYRSWYSGFRYATSYSGLRQFGWWCHEDNVEHAYLNPVDIEVEIMTENPWWDTSYSKILNYAPEVLLLSSRVDGNCIFRAFSLLSTAESCKELEIRP